MVICCVCVYVDVCVFKQFSSILRQVWRRRSPPEETERGRLRTGASCATASIETPEKVQV